jgi:hypothetical protein
MFSSIKKNKKILTTVKLKIFADKNICGEYFCGVKISLLHKEEGHFMIANIITANIFIRNFFVYDGNIFSPPEGEKTSGFPTPK